MISYGNGASYFNGAAFWGLLSVVLMNRAATGSFLDTSAITKKPFKGFTFFMIGASISSLVDMIRFVERGYDRKTYSLHRKIAVNQHTHAILKNLGYHLNTRKMGVWDAAAQ